MVPHVVLFERLPALFDSLLLGFPTLASHLNVSGLLRGDVTDLGDTHGHNFKRLSILLGHPV